MAQEHTKLNEGLYHGRQLADAIRKLTTNWAIVKSTFQQMDQMKESDGSEASHFQEVVDKFGPEGDDNNAQLANAKLLYDEINSAVNNSAAFDQLLARLG